MMMMIMAFTAPPLTLPKQNNSVPQLSCLVSICQLHVLKTADRRLLSSMLTVCPRSVSVLNHSLLFVRYLDFLHELHH